MPEWEYNAWTDQDNVALVQRIFPDYVTEYVKVASGGAKTDIARYLYMYEYGGIYFDTDFRFRKPINEDLLSHKCILGVEDEDPSWEGGGPLIGNAFIASERGLVFWTELVDYIFMRFRKGERLDNAVVLSGPVALTTFLRDHNQYQKFVTILPRNVLYPRRTRFYLTASNNPETIGVHLMWGSWRAMSRPHRLKNRIRRILSALG
jgi:Glycosyltransferase sugar-binding region containing DXD motif